MYGVPRWKPVSKSLVLIVPFTNRTSLSRNVVLAIRFAGKRLSASVRAGRRRRGKPFCWRGDASPPYGKRVLGPGG